MRLAAKLLGWKIDIKSEEEKRQEVEQQMSGFSSGPSTPIEQVAELGETIIQKLVAAGITTVEGLADMTPEQLEEIPGIGEKTLERISVAVRHYFGQYEEGENNPNAAAGASPSDEAKAAEVDEPGTPDEPVEEATAELTAHAEAGHDRTTRPPKPWKLRTPPIRSARIQSMTLTSPAHIPEPLRTK